MSTVHIIKDKAKQLLDKIKEHSDALNQKVAQRKQLKAEIDAHTANLHIMNGAVQAYQDAEKLAQEKEDAKTAPTTSNEGTPVAS